MEELKHLVLAIASLQPASRTPEQVILCKRKFAKEHKSPELPTNVSILKTYKQMVQEGEIEQQGRIEQILKKRAVRSMSGIVPIQVLTKPFRCPGKCIFCPNDATMPKSYINTQPGAMRALLNQFDPYKQAYNRLLSLRLTGHATDKIEMIVLGGTRDVYPQKYKTAFVKGLYDACNHFPEFLEQIEIDFSTPKAPRYTTTEGLQIDYPTTIEESLKRNETAAHRIIGLTIETRPEYVTDKNCQYRRTLGVTRIEMGIQSLDDTVLDMNKRGHGTAEIEAAMFKLRQYGFKISCHFMPGLYGSTVEKDIETFQIAYSALSIKPDEIKFYPTAVIPNTELYELWKQGTYHALQDKDLRYITKVVKQQIIPPYTRIKRLARDFDTNEVVAGANTPNLRQLVMQQMEQEFRADRVLRTEHYGRLWSMGKGDSFLDHRFAGHASSEGQENDELRKCETKSSPDRLYEGKNIIVSGRKGEIIGTQGIASNADLLERLCHPLSIVRTTYTSTDNKERCHDDRIETLVVGGSVDTTSTRGFVCLCTRCREIRNKRPMDKGQGTTDNASVLFPVVRRYRSSNGEELFISYEDSLGYLAGFTRVLLPDQGSTVDRDGLGDGTALIRELHIYGEMEKINEQTEKKSQHKGLGKKLIALAEEIAKARGYQRLSIISGVGVRGYYEKLGYMLEGTYMVKSLC